jgi:hypothetical protein
MTHEIQSQPEIPSIGVGDGDYIARECRYAYLVHSVGAGDHAVYVVSRVVNASFDGEGRLVIPFANGAPAPIAKGSRAIRIATVARDKRYRTIPAATE